MHSKCLENYIKSKIGKDNELSNKDLEQIEEISINNNSVNDIILDYNFKDFLEFPNLKFLNLQNFEIRNFETNIINRLTELKALQFTNCTIKSKCTLRNNVEFIAFSNCKKFKLNYIYNLKKLVTLKIENEKSVNLNKINLLKNIEKIYLKNTKIKNSLELLSLPRIQYINIAGSKYSDKLEKNILEYVEFSKDLLN